MNGGSNRTGARFLRCETGGKVRCLFAVLLCLSLLLPAALSEDAEESVLTKGLYEYVLRPGGDAEIVRYNGEEERLTIPKALDGHPVTAVRAGAFSSDWRLAQVTIPSRVTDLGANPFEECLALTRITVDADHPTLTVADGALYDKRTNTLIAFPAGSEAAHVAVAPGTRIIGDYAFASCRDLVSVILPEGVVSIGGNAFSQCISLREVSLPDSLNEIGESAFAFCGLLPDITLPGALTVLGRDAFVGCGSLVSVTIPDSLTDLKYNPFTACPALERIVLSAAHPTMSMEDGVLYDRTAARLVCYPGGKKDADFTVPAWVREIGAYAFTSHSLISVTLPEGAEEIGESAFEGCSALEKIELPDSLTVIGDSAFCMCRSLNGVNFPQGLAGIGEMAFYNCAITSLTLPEGITGIGRNAFASCFLLKEVFLPEGITVLGEEAFASCHSLAEVSFPSTLEEIGESAFYDCTSLTALSLPDGLTRIGGRAFFRCGSLNAVTLPSGLVQVGRDAFDKCGEDLVFTVPRGGYAEEFCFAQGYDYCYADAPSVLIRSGESDVPRALEHPDLQGRVIGRDQMNLYVYWVQVRLKATGRWYQGEEWDCTGNLGSHTMSEISAFMRFSAGIDHDGTVDQDVIDALLDVPGAPVVPVGGFYGCLDILTGGDRYGDMRGIGRSSPRDAVRWVQTCLKRLGFYTSAVDGDFGPGTLRALHAFQKEYGWVERDSVSYGVARDLLERYIASGGDPNELP